MVGDNLKCAVDRRGKCWSYDCLKVWKGVKNVPKLMFNSSLKNQFRIFNPFTYGQHVDRQEDNAFGW